MKSLSRSTFIMFVFDLLVLSISSTYWYNYFKLPENIQELSVFLVMLSGLFVLFLKGNYKIREFNVNLKNTYLLFEGCILFHIPVAILLLAFANQSVALKFVLFNLLSTFVILRIYRALFLSLDSQNENCRTQNANISILRLVRGKYSNFECHTF